MLLIDKIYKAIGIKHHTVNELRQLVKDDPLTWHIYANGWTLGVNQCEQVSAIKKMMRFKAKNVSELSAWIAAIRPAFKSMYSKFESREHFEYGIPAFDKLLQTDEMPQSFILYQEQTMSVLNYAGFPLDECYGIIKAIAKKHPEKVKPLKSRFLDGFKNKIIQDENVSEDKAAEMSAQVWEIIENSCGYGFNSAHAYCMALDSLYCSYLKAHYPYEFYQTLLQFHSDRGEKDKVTVLKQEMQVAFGIKEGEYKFGIDSRHFVADKDNGVIYPSLLSIKGLSQGCANELYDLSQKNHFDNFYDLWKAINNLPSLNCAKIDTLIKMNYFKDYGSIDKIQKFILAINVLYGKSQFKKDKLPSGWEDIIKKYSEETDKMYRKFNYDAALKEVWNLIPNSETSINKLIQYQNEIYGYISYTDPSRQNTAVVMDVNCKYTPKITLYRLDTGTTIAAKLKKKSYESNPLPVGAIIKFYTETKPAWKKDDQGGWVQDFSRNDTWLTSYIIESYN